MSLIDSKERIRVIVLTDISSLEGGFKEPDDTQSLVRLLLYANDFEIEGLIATYTVHWEGIKPEYIEAIVRAYGKVHGNLIKHDKRYSTEQSLLNCVKSGNPKCGIDQIGPGKDTEGSNWIIHVVDKPDPRPVWIIVWGAPTDLAQALWRVSTERSPIEAARFKSKIRVYAIGDQYDESGPWIRNNHSDLFYITSYRALRGMYRGGDSTLTSPEWLKAHICCNHGPLGEAYPIYDGGDIFSRRLGKVRGVKEGDTPSFLYLIPNGLSDPMKPSWGSWGGRFVGLGTRYFDAMDTFEGKTNELATVYRWRAAYQADFQARMDWCVKSFEEANHVPVARLGHSSSLTVAPGDLVELSAVGSYDPDGDELTYKWEFYRDCSGYKDELIIQGSDCEKASFIAPEVYFPQEIHIVLTVSDNGQPSLSSYKRVVITVDPNN